MIGGQPAQAASAQPPPPRGKPGGSIQDELANKLAAGPPPGAPRAGGYSAPPPRAAPPAVDTKRQEQLMMSGHERNAAGDYAGAQRCFLEADGMGGLDEHLAIARLSAANMALKQGDAAGALAEYDVMLRAAATLPAQLVEILRRKRGEAQGR